MGVGHDSDVEEDVDVSADLRAARLAVLLFATPSAAVTAPSPSTAAPSEALEPPRDVPTERDDDVTARPVIDTLRTRAFVAWYGQLLDAHRAGAQALAAHNLSPGNAPSEVVGDGGAEELLHMVHQALLEHPIAARAIVAGFVREGRHHASTPEGQALRSRLARSRAVHRAALLWRSLTMGMLNEVGEGGLPSAYLDNLARLATDPSLERVLSRVASGRSTP